MTSAAMPFLQRLRPGAGEASRVRPALAPRYATTPQQLGTDAAAVAPAGRAPDAPSGEFFEAPPRERQARAHEEQPSAPRQPSSDPTDDPPVAAAQVQALADPRVERAPRDISRDREPPPIVHGAAAMRTFAARNTDAPRPGAIHGASPQPPTATSHRTPLRESAVEHRLPAPRQAARQVQQQPTVIQVTIDRLDVRAPAAGTPPRPAAKPRGNASTLPLGDYLRQRDRPRNGGAA